MRNLHDKVAVITGAASGIGRALAVAMDQEGCHLVLADLNAAGLNESAALLKRPALRQTLDVADRAAIQSLRDVAIAHYGHVDIVVNNAGVAVSQTVEDLSYADLEWIMGINFWGAVYGTKAFLPHLKTRPEASIVNVSSVFGLIAVPTQGAYNASKFALRGLTEALQWELKGSPVCATGVYPCGIRSNVARNSRFYIDPHGTKSREGGAANFDAMAQTSAQDCAQAIIQAIRNKEKRLLVGRGAGLTDFVQRLMPRSYWPVLARLTPKVG